MRQLKTHFSVHCGCVAAKAIGTKMNGNLLYALKCWWWKWFMAQIVQFFLYLVFVLIFVVLLLLLLAALFWNLFPVRFVVVKLCVCVCVCICSFFSSFCNFISLAVSVFSIPFHRAAMKNMVKVIVRTLLVLLHSCQMAFCQRNEMMKRRLPH